MFKLASYLIIFLREIWFDHADEYKFTSSRFNVKKVLRFGITVSICLISYHFIMQSYKLATANVNLEYQQYKLKADILDLQYRYSLCKKQADVSSDSGNQIP